CRPGGLAGEVGGAREQVRVPLPRIVDALLDEQAVARRAPPDSARFRRHDSLLGKPGESLTTTPDNPFSARKKPWKDGRLRAWTARSGPARSPPAAPPLPCGRWSSRGPGSRCPLR